VTHADGAPLESGRIELTYTDAGPENAQRISERLSRTGEHVFEHLRSGKATLVVKGPGVAPYSTSFEVTEPRRLEVRLPEGRIAGRTVAKDGRPVRVNVMLSTMIDMGHYWSQGSYSDAVETDEDGRFAFSGVGPGRFDFRFSPDGLAVLRGPDVAKAGDTDINLVVGPESEVPRQHIVVRLLDARTGKPAEGAGVGIAEHGESEEGFPGGTGWSMAHFDAKAGAPPGTFISESLAPGEYELTTIGGDYVEKTVKGVRVEENRDTEVTIRLEPVRKLRGRVVDSEGRPVAGALVSWTPMALLFRLPASPHQIHSGNPSDQHRCPLPRSARSGTPLSTLPPFADA